MVQQTPRTNELQQKNNAYTDNDKPADLYVLQNQMRKSKRSKQSSFERQDIDGDEQVNLSMSEEVLVQLSNNDGNWMKKGTNNLNNFSSKPRY